MLSILLICTEGLIALLAKAHTTKQITRIIIIRGVLVINYLHFAYDSILVCKAYIEENKNIQNLRKKYESVSGQQINKAKTSITFSKNVPSDIRNRVLEFWGLA